VIERGVAAFARSPNGGLLVTSVGSALVHRDLIVTLAARHPTRGNPVGIWGTSFEFDGRGRDFNNKMLRLVAGS
jgi:hypothetical protein